MNFLPKNTDFFNTFQKLSLVVKQAGDILLSLKNGEENIELHAKNARKLELKANKIRLRLSEEADTTFITPIDREDIHILARNLDDIVDRIEDVVANIYALRITKYNKDFEELIDIVIQMTGKIHLLIGDLGRKGKRKKEMKKIISEIYELEDRGDEIYKKGINRFFTVEKDPIKIIKWNALFRMIEDISNTSEETAHAVNEIVIKNFNV